MSDKIVWKPEYRIDVAKIDHQHRKLFQCLDRLRLSLSLGLQNPVVGTTLKSLVEYTQTHFKDEEQLMRQIKYDGLERHAELHRTLISEIATTLKRLKTDDEYTALDLITFLEHWIKDHIVQEDMAIGIAYKETMLASATD